VLFLCIFQCTFFTVIFTITIYTRSVNTRVITKLTRNIINWRAKNLPSLYQNPCFPIWTFTQLILTLIRYWTIHIMRLDLWFFNGILLFKIVFKYIKAVPLYWKSLITKQWLRLVEGSLMKKKVFKSFNTIKKHVCTNTSYKHHINAREDIIVQCWLHMTKTFIPYSLYMVDSVVCRTGLGLKMDHLRINTYINKKRYIFYGNIKPSFLERSCTIIIIYWYYKIQWLVQMQSPSLFEKWSVLKLYIQT